MSVSFGVGNTFLLEVLAIKIGLKHVWDMGHKVIMCYFDCSNLVDTFHQNLDVLQYWAIYYYEGSSLTWSRL